MRKRLIGAVATALVVPAIAVLPASTAAAAPAAKKVASDVKELTRTDFTLDGKQVNTPKQYQKRSSAARSAAAAAVTPPVGTVRQ